MLGWCKSCWPIPPLNILHIISPKPFLETYSTMVTRVSSFVLNLNFNQYFIIFLSLKSTNDSQTPDNEFFILMLTIFFNHWQWCFIQMLWILPHSLSRENRTEMRCINFYNFTSIGDRLIIEDLSILSVEKGKLRNFARKHIVVLSLKICYNFRLW